MDARAVKAIVPLTEADVDDCLALLDGTMPLLAVSGGADSISLMGMAADWAKRRGVPLSVAVVDHGLRAGSADEAAFVASEAQRLSLPCAVLRWEGTKPKAGMQEAARAARYELLGEHARHIGADAVVTAHTLDDQAETLLMRLSAGSGPAGMAGMRKRTMTRGVVHLRPLLALPKDRLVATCREHGWRWIEDPSNTNEAFSRVRWRALMPLLAREGLTAERLGLFARRMAENETAMQQMTEAALLRAGLSWYSEGWQLDAHVLFAEPGALVVRALGAVVQRSADEIDCKADGHGPRLARTETCVAAMRAAIQSGMMLNRTLGGQVLSLKRNGRLVGAPEPVRRRGCVNPVRRPSLGNGLPEN